MSSTNLSDLVKKFLKNTKNKKNELLLSNYLLDIINQAEESTVTAVKKKNSTKSKIEIGADDYPPHIYYHMFKNLNKIKFNDCQLNTLESKSTEYGNERNNKIMSFKKIEESNDPEYQKFNKITTGYMYLYNTIFFLKKYNLNSFLKEFSELINNIEEFKKHAEKLKDPVAKKTANILSGKLEESTREYLMEFYSLIQDPSQRQTLEEKTKNYKKEIDRAIETAMPILEKHRANKIFRITSKILLSVASICTLGLILIPKAVYSKKTTGKWTLFNDITISNGYLKKIRNNLYTTSKHVNSTNHIV